jgi:hypothetical protein
LLALRAGLVILPLLALRARLSRRQGRLVPPFRGPSVTHALESRVRLDVDRFGVAVIAAADAEGGQQKEYQAGPDEAAHQDSPRG